MRTIKTCIYAALSLIVLIFIAGVQQLPLLLLYQQQYRLWISGHLSSDFDPGDHNSIDHHHGDT